MSDTAGGKGILGRTGKLRNIEWIALLIGAGLLLATIITPMTRAEEPPAAPALAQEGGQDGVEQRLGDVLSLIDGAGAVRVFITWDAAGEGAEGGAVRGVIVVAEGAEDVAVQMELRRAARVALHVTAQQVEVFAMKNPDNYEEVTMQ